MAYIQYKIKNNNTGKYFQNFIWTRGLRKDGKPRKLGPMLVEAIFTDFESAGFRDIESVNFAIQQGIDRNRSDVFDNCEIIAYTMQPTKTTVRIATVQRRLEANTIMAKLKKA